MIYTTTLLPAVLLGTSMLGLCAVDASLVKMGFQKDKMPVDVDEVSHTFERAKFHNFDVSRNLQRGVSTQIPGTGPAVIETENERHEHDEDHDHNHDPCEDDPTFRLNKNQDRNCAWAASNPHRLEMRCAMVDDDFGLFADNCPATCKPECSSHSETIEELVDHLINEAKEEQESTEEPVIVNVEAEETVIEVENVAPEAEVTNELPALPPTFASEEEVQEQTVINIEIDPSQTIDDNNETFVDSPFFDFDGIDLTEEDASVEGVNLADLLEDGNATESQLEALEGRLESEDEVGSGARGDFLAPGIGGTEISFMIIMEDFRYSNGISSIEDITIGTKFAFTGRIATKAEDLGVASGSCTITSNIQKELSYCDIFHRIDTDNYGGYGSVMVAGTADSVGGRLLVTGTGGSLQSMNSGYASIQFDPAGNPVLYVLLKLLP